MPDRAIPAPRAPGTDVPGRRTVTTALGVALMALGVAGVGASVVALIDVGVGVGWDQAFGDDGRPLVLVTSLIGLVAKAGMAAIGLLVLRRSTRAVALTLATLVLSLGGSALQFAERADRVYLLNPDASAQAVQWAQAAGLWVAAGFVVVLYGGVLVFLRRPATRAEFSAAAEGEALAAAAGYW